MDIEKLLNIDQLKLNNDNDNNNDNDKKQENIDNKKSVNLILAYREFYDKYYKIPFISSEELTKDIELFFPSEDPLIDVCILKSIGDLVYRLINKQKWLIASNIKVEIISLVKDLIDKEPFSYKMNYCELSKIISIYIDSYDNTDSLLTKIKEIINFYIIEQCDFKYNSILKLNFNRRLNYIFNKYCSKWQNITEIYQFPLTIIADRYDSISESKLYIDAVKLLETIDSSAQKVITSLINKTTKEINSFYIAVAKASNDNGLTVDDFEKIERIEKVVFNDFEGKVIDIFNSLLQKLTLRPELYKIINDIFNINRSSHLLTLKLQLSINAIVNTVYYEDKS